MRQVNIRNRHDILTGSHRDIINRSFPDTHARAYQ